MAATAMIDITSTEAMVSEPEPAYGLWSLVVINSLVFIIFAFSFAKPCPMITVKLSM